ncbi:MAG: cation-translocating P-type ATPase [Nanoarchaeota archaeon]
MDFYKLEKEAVLKELNSNLSGLKEDEVRLRLIKYGTNELKEKKENKFFKILSNQLKSFVVYILIAAVVISLITKEYLDATVIAAILVLNTLLGFIQEYKAEKAIESLKKLESKNILVVRNNDKKLIDAKYLVPGDIIIIEEGIKVPADCYLLECYEIEADEAILTGESFPVKKEIKVINKDSQVAERINMLFSSTTIIKGRGKAIVTNTGMNTEVGKIATLIQDQEDKQTPLQKKLDKVGRTLGTLVIAITVIIFITGLIDKQNPADMMLIAISLAVAAVPEGLPAIVTIALALGTKRMVKRNVLIRKLSSVETLGSTTIICADKTGTMTQNKMEITKFYLDGKLLNPGEDSRNLKLMHDIMANCNTAVLPDIGDPTDLGILNAATKGTKYEKVGEIPFTSKNKTMTTFHKVDKKIYTFSKFAPEKIYDLCSHINVNGRIINFTPRMKQEIIDVSDKLATDALRVIGYGYATEKKTKDFIFLGLTGMIDPPKPEVREAVRKCEEAGIRVVMITGDHKLTAQAIAKQVGLGSRVLTGEEIDSMSDEKLKDMARHTDIYARVNPEDKVRILNALYDYNIVAMTGDGVNDAPALKKAHIGIAVGSGTDVAKEASDMIILDNNFNSIVSAVEEGRSIYNDIKKFINYLLSSNFGEVLIIFVAMLIAFHGNDASIVIPLTALQLLWINLVTDGLPALALSIDPISENVMKKPPRNPRENIITKTMIYHIVITGILMAAIVLTLFRLNLDSVVKAQTIAFTTVVILEMVRVQMIRAQYKLKFFSNKWLIVAIASSILLQLVVVYIPGLNTIFKTTPLNLNDWIAILIGGVTMFVLGMLANHIVKRITKQVD